LFINCSKKDDNPNPTTPNPSLNKKNVGDSAKDYLSALTYDKLTIEIISVNGFEPSATVISSFKSFLEARLNKPNGIVIESRSIPSTGLAPYSLADIINYEDLARTKYNVARELTMYIFIAEDAYSDNNNVLGLAYRNTSCAIMGGKIRQLSGGIGQPSESLVLQTVLRHEAAHLLGLVGVGTPVQSDHQDEANGKHCDVTNCLMYYTVESGDFISNLAGLSAPPELDSQCINDLRANGGK
jgi:hypothetical protein